MSVNAKLLAPLASTPRAAAIMERAYKTRRGAAARLAPGMEHLWLRNIND